MLEMGVRCPYVSLNLCLSAWGDPATPAAERINPSCHANALSKTLLTSPELATRFGRAHKALSQVMEQPPGQLTQDLFTPTLSKTFPLIHKFSNTVAWKRLSAFSMEGAAPMDATNPHPAFRDS